MLNRSWLGKEPRRRSQEPEKSAPRTRRERLEQETHSVLFCTVLVTHMEEDVGAHCCPIYSGRKEPMRKGTTAPELNRDQLIILCIDEGKTALSERTALLESAGYHVLPAADANAAMQLFVSHEIDLVLTNNHLHGVSGAELSIFMKQVKPVRVVLLSNPVKVPTNLLSPVDACIEQDCFPEDLLLCLRQVLPKRPTAEADSILMLMEA